MPTIPSARIFSAIGYPLLGVLCSLALIPRPALSSDFDPNKVGQIRARMQAFVDEQEIAGAVTVVGNKDRIVQCEAIGIMNLEDEGKLSIADPVQKYLPEFRGQMLVSARSGDTITLKKPMRPI